ncbi:MAG: hypothetical protein M1820_001854 [Bogoriella megaspora]|nr:MAG: hypothetical protein M1820_001854 [Bogoriella megaspora]
MSSYSDILNGPFMPNPQGPAFNFTSTESRGDILIIICTIFLVFMIVSMLVRVYAALSVRKRIQWSDATCFTGFLLTIAYYASCVLGVQSGYVGRHSWDVSVAELMQSSFFVTSYLENILCPAGLGFIKLSFFLLYMQLFAPFRDLRIAIWIGGSISTLFYVIVVILSFVFDTPRPGETFAAHTATKMATEQVHMSVPLAAVGVVLDLYILVLPFVGVWKLQLSTQRKLGVGLVFTTGLIACVASMSTLSYRSRIQTTDDILLLLVPTLITSLVEMEIGVICSCAPALSQTLRHHLPPYEILRSQISAGLNLSWRLRSRSTGTSTEDASNLSAQSKDSGATSEYAMLSKGMNAPSVIELGNAEPTKTIISGGKGMRSEDGIWMERQVELERSRVQETV